MPNVAIPFVWVKRSRYHRLRLITLRAAALASGTRPAPVKSSAQSQSGQPQVALLPATHPAAHLVPVNLSPALVLLIAAVAGVGAYWAGSRWSRAHAAAELARANAELAGRLRELFLLQEITYLLSESLDPDRIAEQIARYLVRFSDATGAMVVLREETGDRLRVAGAEGSLAPLAGQEVPEAHAGLIALAINQQKLEVAEPAAAGALWPGLDVRRAAIAPLRARGAASGTIVAVDPARPFGPDQLRLLSTVAAHAAAVLTNARLFDLVRLGKVEWESTFDALADGIAVVDGEGRIRRANRALAELLGQPLPAVIGAGLAEELFGRASSLAGLLQAVGRGERLAPLTQHSERLRRILRISAAPMQGTESAGWSVALIEDVTEQRAFETQMIQHEKMAAVGQLVSGVAHELNNPLTSIAGLAELLLEQPQPTPRTKEHLKIIYEQAERASRIVRNLLTFARQGPAEITLVDLTDIARRTALLLEYELRLQQVELRSELSAEPVTVRADRMQLQQVLVNLLTNAVQAVAQNPPERPRRITVRTAAQADRAFFEVEDTGPGVPEELASQIFTPFFTTKEPGQGTGLGLAISYSIIERHGGTLRVERAPGGGAHFIAQLPLAAGIAEVRPGDRISGTYRAWPRGPAARPGLQVLLVDGDPAVQRMITALFSADGYLVEPARDGPHALKLLEGGAYDVVIADPREPVSATEVFGDALARQRPDLRARTIFTPADVRPETESWLKELGFRYLHKPVNAGQLRAAVAELLQDPAAREAS